jgi:phytanoyl-CoA hydroxylase
MFMRCQMDANKELRVVMVQQSDIETFQSNGYAVARGLFSRDEAESYIDHFMLLREADSYAGDFSGVESADDDPLRAFPRMIHMHRWDQTSLDWMIDPRIGNWLQELTGQPAYAVQTMLYFKPAGSRGQALHQDQFYLKAKPGTCMAAWMALDACDVENGCLQVVPKSGDLPVLCTEKADIGESFTDVTVPMPEDVRSEPVIMGPGDVLFFNGSVIHGSLPNTTTDRFRRSLIGHYVTGDAKEVSKFYKPVLDMAGNEIDFGESEGGGPCGVWVEQEGQNRVEVPA